MFCFAYQVEGQEPAPSTSAAVDETIAEEPEAEQAATDVVVSTESPSSKPV